MKKVFLILFFIHFSLFAQEEPIDADRPDQSEGVYVLPKKQFQIEDGFDFSEEAIANNLMFRYGILKKTEIRLVADFQVDTEKSFQFNNVVLSAKHHILKGNGWLPSITAVGYFTCNVMPERSFSGDFTMAFENEFSEKISFCWNIGVSHQLKNGIFTAEFNYNPTQKIGLFAEYFVNFLRGNIPNNSVDIGLMYAVTPYFQADMAFGRSLTSQSDYFGVVGFAYKMKR